MKKKYIAGIAAVVIVAACAVPLLGKGQTYSAVKAYYGNIQGTVNVTGNIHGEEIVHYYSDIDGQIDIVYVKNGSVIDEGGVLAVYDKENLENQKEALILSAEYARNGYDAAMAENAKNSTDYEQALTDDAAYEELYNATLERINQLEIILNDRVLLGSEEAQTIQEEIIKKTQELETIQADMAIKNSMLAAGDTSKLLDVQIYTNQIKELSDEIARLNQQLNNINNGMYTSEEYAEYIQLKTDLEEIAMNRSEAKTDKATKEALVMNAKAVDQLYTSLQMTQLDEKMKLSDIDNAMEGIIAGMNGIVTGVFVNENQYVTKGTPLFSLESNDDVKMTVTVSKYEIDNIETGQRAVINVCGNSYEGTVSYINKVAVTDTSNKAKISVDIHIDNPDDKIILGIEGDALIYTKEATDVLMIPRTALYTDDAGDYCYIIENGKVAKKYITTGIVTDSQVEVKEGLSEGTVVITDAVTDDKIGGKANGSIN